MSATVRIQLAAAASPIWKFCSPVSAIQKIAVWVCLPGAPLVMMNAWPNMFAEAMIVTMVTNMVTGRRPGSVTCQNDDHQPAPSTRAASYSSRGMSWSPAM